MPKDQPSESTSIRASRPLCWVAKRTEVHGLSEPNFIGDQNAFVALAIEMVDMLDSGTLKRHQAIQHIVLNRVEVLSDVLPGVCFI